MLQYIFPPDLGGDLIGWHFASLKKLIETGPKWLNSELYLLVSDLEWREGDISKAHMCIFKWNDSIGGYWCTVDCVILFVGINRSEAFYRRIIWVSLYSNVCIPRYVIIITALWIDGCSRHCCRKWCCGQEFWRQHFVAAENGIKVKSAFTIHNILSRYCSKHC